MFQGKTDAQIEQASFFKSQHLNALSLWEMSERGIGLQIMIASTPEEFNELVRLSFLTHSLHASQEKETIK